MRRPPGLSFLATTGASRAAAPGPRETSPAPAAATVPTDAPVPAIFDGNNYTCTVCIQEFVAGERVIRLLCRHVFHGTCWSRLTLSTDPSSATSFPDCPNCRSLGQIIAMWDYVDPMELTQPGVPNMITEPRMTVPPGVVPIEINTPRSVQTEHPWGTPSSTFSGIVPPSTYTDANDWVIPEDIGPGREEGFTYHVDTRLRDGRPSLLIDPGSVGNLGGDQWAREASKVAIDHHRRPEQVPRARALDVTGVGHGSQSCTHNCRIPIMMRQLNGQFTSGTFETPVVPGSELPALLGLKSLTQARCILDLTTNQIHLCGPGKPQFELPPGSESYQLEIAPSGHLMLPCSEFRLADRHPRTTANSSENSLSLTTVEHNPTASGSSSSGPSGDGRLPAHVTERASSSSSGRLPANAANLTYTSS